MAKKLQTGKQVANQGESLFLDELEEGYAGLVVVMVSRKWDVCINGKYLSTDFLISDSRGNIMHCMARHNKSYKFVDRMQEGRFYTLTGCKVIPNRKEYRILKDSEFMIELDGSTSVKNAKCGNEGFCRYPFQIMPIEKLKPTDNKYLVDLIGYVTHVGDPVKKSNGSETVEFNLTSEGGRQIRMTLWGSLGEEMIKNKSTRPGPYVVLLTAMGSKVFLGELGVSSTSSTQIIDNEEIPVIASFKDAISGIDVDNVSPVTVDTTPVVETLDELLQWGRSKKSGLVGEQENVVFRNMVELVDIRTRNGWYLTTCSSGRCRKMLTRSKGSFWCDGCNSSVLYPRMRYKIQMEIRDESAQVIVVLFDEAAERLLNRTAKSLMDEEIQSDAGDDVLPPVLRELIGTKHVFEIKGHTYYQFGEYESFNCSQVIIPAVDSSVSDSSSKQGKVMKIGADPPITLSNKVEMIATPVKKGEHKRRKLSLANSVDGSSHPKSLKERSKVSGGGDNKSLLGSTGASKKLGNNNELDDLVIDEVAESETAVPDQAPKQRRYIVDSDGE